MKEHGFVRQISDHLVKGGFEASFNRSKYGIGNRIGISELIVQSMDKKIPQPLLCADALDNAMKVSIRKFEDGEYMFPELAFRAKCTGDARDILWKQMGDSEAKGRGKIALITGPGEKHVFGKKVVKHLLRGIGFKTIDMGNAVPVDEIIRSVKYHKPDYLGISITTASTISEIEKTIERLSDNEYFEDIQIIIGGHAVGAGFTESFDVDYSCGDIYRTLDLFKNLENNS
jgi:methanogenic corrinoid protein MtbC1